MCVVIIISNQMWQIFQPIRPAAFRYLQGFNELKEENLNKH